MINKLRDKTILSIFKISQKPVKLKALLEANWLLNNQIRVDNRLLGYKTRNFKAFIIFLVITHLAIIPVFLILHKLFTFLDCHISILVSIFFTASLFTIFGFFKDWASDYIAKKIIIDSWSLHFAFFSYAKYNKIVNNIFNESKKDDISDKNLETYILDKVSKL